MTIKDLCCRDIVPLGQNKSNFNYNLDEKRVLNFENVVDDSDNVKQDMSIDVYGRKQEGEDEPEKGAANSGNAKVHALASLAAATEGLHNATHGLGTKQCMGWAIMKHLDAGVVPTSSQSMDVVMHVWHSSFIGEGCPAPTQHITAFSSVECFSDMAA